MLPTAVTSDKMAISSTSLVRTLRFIGVRRFAGHAAIWWPSQALGKQLSAHRAAGRAAGL